MEPVIKSLALQILFLLIQLVFIITFWDFNFILCFQYFLAFLYLFNLAVKNKEFRSDFLLFLVAFLFFIPGEFLLSTFGVYKYSNPGILNVPLWIGFSWGFTAVSLSRIRKAIYDFLNGGK